MASYGMADASPLEFLRRTASRRSVTQASKASNANSSPNRSKRIDPSSQFGDGEDPIANAAKPKHIFEKMSATREAHALERWEKAQKDWGQVKQNISKRVGKEADQLLLSKVDEFRIKQEEIGLMDRFIPPHMRFGHRSWEMSLRRNEKKPEEVESGVFGGLVPGQERDYSRYDSVGEAEQVRRRREKLQETGQGGTQYVQVGSAFPYSIYCPVKEYESNPFTFIRRPPSQNQHGNPSSTSLDPRNTKTFLLSELDFYKMRKKQYEKYVQELQSHQPDMEGLEIIGENPLKQQQNQAHDMMIDDFASSMPASSRGRNSNANVAFSQQQQQQPVGPRLRFSDTRLNLLAKAGTIASGTLTVSNIGSSAILFQWVRVYCCNSLKTGSHESNTFFPSSQLQGVILPGNEANFTFSFKSSIAGIFSERWDFITDPVLSSQPFSLSLRGVSTLETPLNTPSPSVLTHVSAPCDDLAILQAPQPHVLSLVSDMLPPLESEDASVEMLENIVPQHDEQIAFVVEEVQNKEDSHVREESQLHEDLLAEQQDSQSQLQAEDEETEEGVPLQE